MSEFSRRAECPHCGSKTWVNIEFNFEDADDRGCDSAHTVDQCNECGEPFIIKGHLIFEIDVDLEAITKEEKK